MTPAAFRDFFDTTFAEALRTVEIPGAPTASWDRKAAWLLWISTDEGRAFVSPSSEMTTDAPNQEVDIFG